MLSLYLIQNLRKLLMIAFLIDADNFSSPAWIDEAFQLLERTEGPVAIRRAYGSAENLKGLSDTLRTLAIRPFVNMSMAKNSTDMALAVDVMELACLEPRPKLIVIGSGDSDFVPLVVRLRERGIKVFCVTLRSKLSQDAIPAYDQIFYVGSEAVTKSKATKAKVAGTKVAVPVSLKKESKLKVVQPAPSKAVGAKKAAAKSVPTTPASSKPESSKPAPSKPAASKPAPSKPAPSKPAPSKPAAKKIQSVPKAQATATAVVGPTVSQILLAVPQLKSGDWLLFRDIAKVLHDKKLLAKNATSPKLFKKFPTQFELEPADKPQKVRLKREQAQQ
jgi:NYN domain